MSRRGTTATDAQPSRKGVWLMSDIDWGRMDDIAERLNAESPICTDCGMPLESEKDLEHELCGVCWDYVTK